MNLQCNSTRVKAPDITSAPSKSMLVNTNTNDGLVSKPVDTILGRTKLDADKDGQDKFVKRKTPFIISTFNIRTLNSQAKKGELAHEAAYYGIDIICLQEHRIVHSDSLLQEDLNGYRLITSSAWKNQRNAATGGVGFLISPRALNSCLSIINHNERIMEISLQGNPTSTVLCCYSPHNEQPEEAVTSFYQELSSTINSIPAHNLLIIGGDFNAQLGPLDALFTPAKETNRNGTHMKDLLEEHSLIATNTRFQNRIGRLWTHRRPNGQLVQLDFILVRKKWINSIKNSRAYSSFEGVNSDHRIVSCKCQISYRKCRTSKKDPMKCVDWKKVARDASLSEQFAIAVYNRFTSLHDELHEPNISTTYDTLVTANEEVALEILPKKSKQVKSIATDKVTEARDALKYASMKHNARSTRASQKLLETAKATLDKAYTESLESSIQRKTEELDNLHHEYKHAASWELLREITDTKSTPVVRVKGNTSEERRDNWFQHFSNLLGKPEQDINLEDMFFNSKVSDDLPIHTGPFTIEELQKGLSKLNKSKTPGPDNIPAIVWKNPLYHQQLLDFCNETMKGNKPNALSRSTIIPIPKKGDLSLPSNYRGITLSALAAKLYNTMLLNRISPHLDPILRRNQNGFRKGRSTTPQILALRRIIEELKISKKQAYIVFVDFSKAFDSVNRKAMLHILLNYGIPQEIVKAIAIMYDNPSSFVQTFDGPTEEFQTAAGILQGDTLAPFLFVIVVDYILRQSIDTDKSKGIDIMPNKTNREKNKYLTDLDYADDIALTATLLQDAQDLLSSLEDTSAKVGLFLNAKKTEYMCVNGDDNPALILARDGTQLKEVSDFKYLGSFVADSKKDFLTRKAQAWKACNKLHNIWQSNISRKTKLAFFRACIESILLYGSETWTMKKDLQDRLDGTYTRLLMRVQNISWREHKSKTEIYNGVPQVSSILAQRRARFAGHCYRAKDQIISDVICMRLPRTCRGRRPFNYIDCVARDINQNIIDLPNLMADRNSWRDIVNSFSDASAR